MTDIRIGALEKQRLSLGLYKRKKNIKKKTQCGCDLVDVIVLEGKKN